MRPILVVFVLFLSCNNEENSRLKNENSEIVKKIDYLESELATALDKKNQYSSEIESLSAKLDQALTANEDIRKTGNAKLLDQTISEILESQHDDGQNEIDIFVFDSYRGEGKIGMSSQRCSDSGGPFGLKSFREHFVGTTYVTDNGRFSSAGISCAAGCSEEHIGIRFIESFGANTIALSERDYKSLDFFTKVTSPTGQKCSAGSDGRIAGNKCDRVYKFVVNKDEYLITIQTEITNIPPTDDWYYYEGRTFFEVSKNKNTLFNYSSNVFGDPENLTYFIIDKNELSFVGTAMHGHCGGATIVKFHTSPDRHNVERVQFPCDC